MNEIYYKTAEYGTCQVLPRVLYGSLKKKKERLFAALRDCFHILHIMGGTNSAFNKG